MFFTWWPWPLTSDLDHQTNLRYHQGQSLYQILWPYINPFNRENANKQIRTHTNGSVSITLTAHAGGYNFTGLKQIWFRNIGRTKLYNLQTHLVNSLGNNLRQSRPQQYMVMFHYHSLAWPLFYMLNLYNLPFVYQWSPKLFLVCRTKCLADIQCSAGHFDSLPDILLPDVQAKRKLSARHFMYLYKYHCDNVTVYATFIT